MTAAAEIHRTTEITCPPWCAGHQGSYQGWEEKWDGSGFLRDHAEVAGRWVGGIALAVVQVQDSSNGFLPPVVEVFIDEIGGGARRDLSAAEAREMAAVLLESAERLEANR